MSNIVSDYVYKELSRASYEKEGTVSIDNSLGETQKWKPLHPNGAKLHDPTTGFDATVFVNEDTKQVVVAFRGTEGTGPFKRAYPDIKKADGGDVVLGTLKDRKDELARLENSPTYSPDDEFRKEDLRKEIAESQFTQADELMKKVKEHVNKHYTGYEISATGHSLGGALAEYSAVLHHLQSVTYSAPDIVHLLPKDLQEKATRGEFKDTNISYVNPNDSIGAGPFKEYKQHVGKTIYIGGAGFAVANAGYTGHPVERFIDSVGSKDYHGLDNYTYDKNGNISNLLIDAKTGKELIQSPRYIQGSQTIELKTEDLHEIGNTMKKHAKQFEQEIPPAIRAVTALLYTSQSQKLKPIAENICGDLGKSNRWYLDKTNEMAEFISKKANEFQAADGK
ncbi:lipase family protein [Ectobacillus panaciterrae]|uniref:lipase family protein n=1 Tax=Ectobacillus panaciterrae TaxID=363872 RepID=UPI00041CD359|nr:hypothetical protein [Ectobacillus panaciterrae]